MSARSVLALTATLAILLGQSVSAQPSIAGSTPAPPAPVESAQSPASPAEAPAETIATLRGRVDAVAPAGAASAPPPGTAPALEASAPQVPVLLDEAVEALRPRLMAMPGVRAVRQIPDAPGQFTVVAAREHLLSLDRLLTRLNAPNADRALEYDRFTALIRDLIERHDPFKPAQLRVIIRPIEAVEAFERETALDGIANTILKRPFASGLVEVVAGDTPTSIALMPAARLADLRLGGPQAFELGRANVAQEARAARWSEDGGLLVAELDGSYEASLLAVDGIWRAMEQRLGGQVAVAAPTRSRIVVGRANKGADMRRLRAIASTEATGPGRLTDKVLIRRGNAWMSE